jgi:hypothetical protein
MLQETNQTKRLSSEENSLFELIYEALLQNPLCLEIEKDIIEIFAKEAIKREEFNNDQWLKEKIKDYQDLGRVKFIAHYQNEIKSLEINKKQETEKIESAFQDLKPSQQNFISSQQELNSIIKDHSLWIKSVLHPSEKITAGRANLKGLDLRNYDLKGANLSCADLSQTNLSHLDLTDVNFSKARLEDAVLVESDLRKTKLKNAVLTGANLAGALLNPSVLNEVNLKEALNVPKIEEELPTKEKNVLEEFKLASKKEEKAHPLLHERLI